MHLSEHPKYATVAKPRFDGAGAPDIDIAPLRDAFRTWWAQNDRFLADGDTGDVLRLYLMVETGFSKCNLLVPGRSERSLIFLRRLYHRGYVFIELIYVEI
jgi:hypothetical protein